MKGHVEVYKFFGTPNQKLVFEEDNLIMDGAGELLVDMLTTTPSLSGVSTTSVDSQGNTHAVSALLDASNYTIQAISFGKGAGGYTQNAHFPGSSLFNQVSSTLFPMTDPSTAMIAVGTGTSSYTPIVSLPKYPDPIDTKLETDNTATHIGIEVNKSLGGSGSDFDIGHNLNFMPSSISENLKGGSNDFVHRFRQLYGCYPEGSSVGGSKWKIVDDSESPIVSGVYNSLFNEVSSMDSQGMLMSVTGTDSTKGLITSSNSDFSSTGEISFISTVGSGDLGMSNLFGGIYNIGLWGIDNALSIQGLDNSEAHPPPYITDIKDNPRRYKLFAKKSFTQNLCEISDTGSTAGALDYQDLTIIWRIKV
tara:strand:+ start:795 stop:1886 length:1092 start_codon:yes stop_codon:yes gene_type:complete